MKIVLEAGPDGISLGTNPPNVDPLVLLGLLEIGKAIVLERMKAPASPIVVPSDAAALGRQVHS